MMGVYIKNMDVPESCLDCPFVDYFKRMFFCPVINDMVTTEVNGRDEKCSLLKIKPHGRLVDADELGKDLMKRWNVNDDHDFCNKEVWNGIKEAKTVIPTDKE